MPIYSRTQYDVDDLMRQYRDGYLSTPDLLALQRSGQVKRKNPEAIAEYQEHLREQAGLAPGRAERIRLRRRGL